MELFPGQAEVRPQELRVNSSAGLRVYQEVEPVVLDLNKLQSLSLQVESDNPSFLASWLIVRQARPIFRRLVDTYLESHPEPEPDVAAVLVDLEEF